MIIVNEDRSVYVTRGDSAMFTVSADVDGERLTFKPGDLVRLKVFEKKNANNVVLQKDFPIEALTEIVTIYLTSADTKIGSVISKPVVYWYEIELNPFTYPQTIVGYDNDGAKIFKLFPEGRDLEDDPITEEDIPIVDVELDASSTRPVQNQAIARAITKLNAMVYPIGSIYMSVNETSPSVLFGGTWERIKDRFLLAAGDKYVAGSEGGEEKHTLQTWEMPEHTHNITDTDLSSGVTLGIEWGQFVPESSSEKSYGITIDGTMRTTEAGSGEAHNNMPPYLAVHMWVRTA